MWFRGVACSGCDMRGRGVTSGVCKYKTIVHIIMSTLGRVRKSPFKRLLTVLSGQTSFPT